jgi:hypothetical protein
MVTRVSQRLAEGAAPIYYPKAEIVAALNEAQRFFCLLTLGLEVTSPWAVTAEVRPARFEELTSLDSGWPSSPGAPYKYVAAGVDFVAVYRQPAGAGTVLNVTYARAPLPLVSDADVPEIPAEYHPKLVEFGIYRMRQVEGGQEFAKTLPMLAGYLDGAQHYADYVRARNKGSRYDAVPFELKSFDRSEMFKSASRR